MGKQSRRKKGVDKEAKKVAKLEQLQRQHAPEQHHPNEQYQENAYDIDEPEELAVGRRVCFEFPMEDSEATHWTQGIVKQLEKSTCYVLRIQDAEGSGLCAVQKESVFVMKDTVPWTLRFQKGDAIVLNFSEKKCWVSGVVMDTWPIGKEKGVGIEETRRVPFYRISTDEVDSLHLLYNDHDDQIIRKLPESFRFAKGDSVVFSSAQAGGLTNRRRDPWIRGKISQVNVLGEAYYAVYKCTFMENGKRRSCYIVKDDDQHVASISSSLRERLMEAIEQDCDYYHIDYLCTGMDVMPFRDLLLSHAIEHGSYNALAWLQNNASVELHKIWDFDQNGLLHQIAKGRHAERFILAAVARLNIRLCHSKIDFIDPTLNDEDCLLLQRNSQGRLWLHELVISGNARAFELALSPTALLWITLTRLRWGQLKFEGLRDINGLNLKDTALLLGRNMMENILDKADEISVLSELQMEVLDRCEFLSTDISTDAEEREQSDCCVGVPDLETLDAFDGDSASLVAKRLVRLSRDYGTGDGSDTRPASLESLVGSMAEALYLSALSWVVDEDANMLNSVTQLRSTCTRQNQNEFAQPELYAISSQDEMFYTGLIEQATLGQLRFYSVGHSTRNEYFAFLYTHIKESTGSTKWTLLIDLKWQLDMLPEDDDFFMMVKYKLDLLQDHKCLKPRLKMLDYLVKEKGLQPPKALDIIRWRQCGVLRWLLRGSFINLEARAHQEKTLLSREGRFLNFLGGRKIPHTMTVGVFLCFAAIEFDDQQSLQWLVQDNKIPISQVTCHGWNAVHCSAYFGRIEIFLWLRSLKTVKPLLAEPCSRKPHEGALAAHIAVSQGHILLADLLLSSGCPMEDTTGKSVCLYAEQSEHAFVQEWGNEREKPSLLEKDIQKLRQLLSSKKAKPGNVMKHISESKCMEANRWVECGFTSASESGPCGKSYRDVLAECCKITVPGYIKSLCKALTPSRHFAYTEQQKQNEGLFWSDSPSIRNGSQLIDLNCLKTFAEERNDEVACHYLQRPWTKGIKCEEPSQCYHVLRELLNRFREDSSVSVALGSFRDSLLRLDLMMKIRAAQMDRVKKELVKGARSIEVENEICGVMEITADLAKVEGQQLGVYFSDREIVLPSGKVNIECELDCNYGDRHPLNKMAFWNGIEESAISKAHLFLAVEGYTDLISWSRIDNRGIWDLRKESDVVRIASYFGHTEIVDAFLQDPNFQGTSNDILSYAALFGYAEAGRVVDLASYFSQNSIYVKSSDEFVHKFEQAPLLLSNWAREKSDLEQRRLKMQRSVASSLVGCVVYASLQAWNQNNVQERQVQVCDVYREVIKLLVSKAVVDVRYFVRAAAKILLNLRALHCYERCADLIKYLLDDCGLDVWTCQEELHQISEVFLCYFYRTSSKKIDRGRLYSLVVQWCEFVSSIGCDIQCLKRPSTSRANAEQKSFARFFDYLQATQRNNWAQSNFIIQGRPIEAIQRAVEDGEVSLTARYKQGLLVSHLAAAYDRPDVLKWLVNEKGMSLEARDGNGRTVPEVAMQANVENVCDWITREREMQSISKFVSSNFRRRRAMNKTQHTLRCIILIQAAQRGRSARRTYSNVLVSRLEETVRFQGVWKRSIDAMLRKRSLESGGDFSWTELKHAEHDIMQTDLIDDLDEFTETAQILGEAVTLVAPREEGAKPCSDDEDDDCGEDSDKSLEHVVDENDGNCVASNKASDVWQPTCNFESIKMTKEVIKWLGQGDSKYREFFVRRIEQLAAGERSRILAKRLAGCETTIYETYLEQKSGHRILWTESRNGLLIWYVAKHKNVSRLMSLIDDAESRSKRQLIPASELSDIDTTNNVEGESAIEEQIMLDPLGDTPLKLYEVAPNDIEKLKEVNWKPQLYLTSREREIVETNGTVLVLGRSGTGKTCVICNRMDYDRQRAGGQFGFSQLFVARSHRLCSYVREVVDISGTSDASNAKSRPSMQFEVFGEVIRMLESTLPSREGTKDIFLPSHKMDYGRFKREVYQPDSSDGLDALVVWTNIRSFIKGSIEALTSASKLLSKNEYLGLGKRRCRLSPDQRAVVYATFERYNAYMEDLRLWDDCDRILALVQRMEHARSTDLAVFQEMRYNKLYVDEVQDYTQAEIALFFYLCGAGDLFLAGDPAQSVVEGVEFRFEEVRSVGYHLYGEDRRHLIPDKPKTVHLNFRSHCGILNVAAAVLSCLFQAFPDGAKQLKEDRGLFQGPRPGVFDKVARSRLRELVLNRNGIVVLTHDAGVASLRRALDEYPLVYGIREAKGLEFQEVVLVDFFAGVPKPLQKLWRDLLLGRDASHVSQRPEIEGQLKLLYTAITRCIQRLYFAETRPSVAGDAFIRWLTTTTTSVQKNERKDALAIKNSIDEVEKMLRTPDEWRSAGLDNAVIAESSDDLEESQKWLERAIYCFEQVGIQGDTALASRARVHRSSICFRRDLLEGGKVSDVTQKEVEAARLTENLLHEQLLMEARQVCDAVLPLLQIETQEMLQNHLISRLPSVERDDY